MRHIWRGAFWIALYLLLIIAPLFVLLIGQAPPGRGFWREFSVGLGFVGLSMMGLQFFLTGRFRHITSPYGIDVVYHFHRQISIIAFFFILLHPVILISSSPSTLVLLNPLTAPWWITIGTGGLLAFIIVIVTSLYRIEMGIIYEHWRIIHGYMSVVAVAFSMTHIAGVSYYVQEPVKRWLWISMVIGWILALLYIRIVKPISMLRRPYLIENVIKERGDSWTLALKPHGHKGMNFKPGQFAWLTIGKSPFAIREHPFSFSSSAMNPGQIEMTIKELGDFTSKIGEVAKGTRAFMDGPYGTFTIDHYRSSGYVFIAGGVGITPIISILKTMADRNDLRPVVLFYQSKTLEGTTFREELENLKKRLNLQVIHILSQPSDDWEGETGRINENVIAKYLPSKRMEYEYLVCGPQPMQMALKEALKKLGISLERVQSESFNFV